MVMVVLVVLEGIITVVVAMVAVMVIKKTVVRMVMIKLVVHVSSGPGTQIHSSISLDQNTRRWTQ